MANPFAAAQAYAGLANIGASGAGASKLAKAASESGGGFADMVQNAIGDVATMGKTADAKAQAMAVGKTDLVDVVTAVAETEVAVETLVSVRDRVVQAYEEIMRMPI